ncbi:protein ECERIFERUM 2-like [Malania oleifera]|uniref:protein ECERIFERUM 2-like n=1 Tax=Malania oleifera TaxID=397392 RepID=UPI0025AE785C|nr:protein ECERIFERUM 2-like [Malania oleifera]
MTDRKSSVTLQSKLTVVSSVSIGPGKTHPLSALDHSMGLHTLHFVYYYKNIAAGTFHLNPLRRSLSEALSLYPPVTGRLTRRPDDGNWQVKCNDAGVRVLQAKVAATLDEWLRSADWSQERDLTVWEDMPEDPYIWSPFRIQINDFEGGGVAIGLSCTHLFADLTSAALLFKSWTDSHCGEAIAIKPSFYPSGLHRPAVPNTDTNSTSYYTTKSQAKPPSVKMATVTFRFSSSRIKQCLSSEVHQSCPNATPFDLLAALFWTRVASLKAHAPGHDHTQTLSICMDSRKLGHGKNPTHGYFGNALHFSLLSLDADELENAGLGHVAGLVHRHVSGLREEEVQSLMDWLESRKGKSGEYAPPFRMYGPELTCIDMEHMVSGSTFEKGEKPVHVACHVGNVEGEGLILVMPSPEEGLGRTVMVTLPEQQMAKLCEDQAIRHLEPTMLVSGRC